MGATLATLIISQRLLRRLSFSYPNWLMVYAQHIDCYGQNDKAREDKTNADYDTSPAKQKKLKHCYFGTLKLNPIQMGEGF